MDFHTCFPEQNLILEKLTYVKLSQNNTPCNNRAPTFQKASTKKGQ